MQTERPLKPGAELPPCRLPRTAPILVTGTHRSGSTWVGQMLNASPEIGYISEPFNPTRMPGLCEAPFERWFTCVTAANEQPYRRQLTETLGFRYRPEQGLRGARSLRDLRHVLGNCRTFHSYRRRGVRPLLKDPIALFSAPWLAESFGMQVIVMIRHPAAFASSIQRLGWGIPFEDLLAQPLLMRRYLAGFDEEIRRQVRRPGDLVSQAALFWRIAYSTVRGYQRQYRDWIYLRHEDVAAAPVARFGALFEQLRLEFSPAVRRTILRHSRAGNPVYSPHPHDYRRDSAAVRRAWSRRLTPAEIRRVRDTCADVWPHFYSDDDW